MIKRKICVVTGTRAEYGLLYGLMKAIQKSEAFELQVLASAMHLSPEFGSTYKVIEQDGFCIDAKVEMLLSGDSHVAITKSLGLGVIGFADAYERLKPELVVLLGDRFEALAAAQAALIASIPIAHIHGGELTEGAIDESIRHSITKMAHLHFVSTEVFRRRVIQLGEQPGRVYVSGAPGIDNIKKMNLMSKSALESSLGFELGANSFLVTYHPVTLASSENENTLHELFQALDSFSDAKLIITYPNADAKGREMIRQLKRYAEENKERVFLIDSLGQLKYLSALQHVDMVIGNSSSGLLEVPSFYKPTVNIGDRQKGRLKAKSVIDCVYAKKSIELAISKGLSVEFQSELANVVNPYGSGNASEKIMDILSVSEFSELTRKPFYDFEV